MLFFMILFVLVFATFFNKNKHNYEKFICFTKINELVLLSINNK